MPPPGYEMSPPPGASESRRGGDLILGLTPPGYGNGARSAGWIGTGGNTVVGLTPPGYCDGARSAGCGGTGGITVLGLMPPGYGNGARSAGWIGTRRITVQRFGFRQKAGLQHEAVALVEVDSLDGGRYIRVG